MEVGTATSKLNLTTSESNQATSKPTLATYKLNWFTPHLNLTTSKTEPVYRGAKLVHLWTKACRLYAELVYPEAKPVCREPDWFSIKVTPAFQTLKQSGKKMNPFAIKANGFICNVVEAFAAFLSF
ncbi:MAG: hypothetical protein EOO01_30630 [Chitinophagaceae bacterium]|nr:MAG: hypothetical protein EOO01_30630 [Chitinophagaceae bacterium]